MSEPLEGWRERAKQDMARVSWSEKKPNGSEIPVLEFRISIGIVLSLLRHGFGFRIGRYGFEKLGFD